MNTDTSIHPRKDYVAENKTGGNEYYPTVSAVIVHSNKTLLLLHAQHNLWLAPSGHVFLNETPIDAVYRQTATDTGITDNYLKLLLPYSDNMTFERGDTNSTTQPMPFDINVFSEAGTHYHVDYGYTLVSTTDEITAKSEVASEARWFTEEELDDLLLTTKSTISRAKYALRQARENQSA